MHRGHSLAQSPGLPLVDLSDLAPVSCLFRPMIDVAARVMPNLALAPALWCLGIEGSLDSVCSVPDGMEAVLKLLDRPRSSSSLHRSDRMCNSPDSPGNQNPGYQTHRMSCFPSLTARAKVTCPRVSAPERSDLTATAHDAIDRAAPVTMEFREVVQVASLTGRAETGQLTIW